MSEQQDGTTGTEGQTEGQAGGTEENEDTLPEWARKKLSKANSEAANYRTKLRDAETKLGTAKSVEEFEAARTELTEANKTLERKLLVETVGRGLPDDLRALLKGETEAELKAHAEVLKKYAPAQEAPPERLGGGLNANQGADDFDVKKIARMARLGRL